MVSLQEQLLKAGLVDQKKVKRVNQAKTQQKKQERRTGTQSIDETRQAVLEARERERETVRQLNAKRDEEARRKAIHAQIVQMVEQSRQGRGGGDIAYNFTFGTKIERIHVSAAVRDQLAAGQLVIVRLGDATELVPKVVADKIAERNPDIVVRVQKADTVPAEDDPYADYKIPDDLMWRWLECPEWLPSRTNVRPRASLAAGRAGVSGAARSAAESVATSRQGNEYPRVRG